MLKKSAESGLLDPDETIVVYVTGNGLKTPEAVADTAKVSVSIEATMEDFEQALGARRELVRA